MEQFSRLGLAMHLSNLTGPLPDGEEQPVTKGDDPSPSSKEETDGAVGVAKQEVVTLTSVVVCVVKVTLLL